MTKTHTSGDRSELAEIHEDPHHTGRGNANLGRADATSCLRPEATTIAGKPFHRIITAGLRGL
jgi:hypothetical protein